MPFHLPTLPLFLALLPCFLSTLPPFDLLTFLPHRGTALLFHPLTRLFSQPSPRTRDPSTLAHPLLSCPSALLLFYPSTLLPFDPSTVIYPSCFLPLYPSMLLPLHPILLPLYPFTPPLCYPSTLLRSTPADLKP